MKLLSLNRGAVHGSAATTTRRATPWNKGKLLGQKPPLKLKEIWAIRIRLQLDHRARELALFNLAIDSKLRGCDLVALRVHDVVQGSHVAARAIVMQKKTQRPVQFEITEQTRDAVAAWITAARLKPEQFLFPSRVTVFHASGTPDHGAGDLNHPFGPDVFTGGVDLRRGLLVDGDLGDPPAVAQIPENQPALVAPAMDPTGQRDLLTGVFRA